MTSDADLPALPEGAQVTAWGAGLPGDMQALSPRAVAVMLLHVSWLRWSEYAALLEEQVRQSRARDSARSPGGSSGLVGHRIGVSKDGPYPAAEEIRALTRLEADERDRCADLAKRAHDMGII